MKSFLIDILMIVLLPIAIVLAIWDGIISFFKAFIKGLKDWSDYLE